MPKKTISPITTSFRPYLLRLCALVFLALWSEESIATHIVGGEIYYTHLGDNDYEITLLVYRDCSDENTQGTGFDPAAPISIYDENGTLLDLLEIPLESSNVSPIPIVSENPCFILPPNLCIERAVYRTTTSLPVIQGGYDIVYQRCCRNGTIINLEFPSDTGMTLTSHIPGLETNAQGDNSAPVFTSLPTTAMCLGGEFFFDHSAVDPDGDLLGYELCTPFFGGTPDAPAPNPPTAPPFVEVIWGPGYDTDYQLASNPDFSIDPITGQLTGTPTQVGKYAVGICVSEYRNGELLGTTMRDFQYNVTSCDPTIIAAVPSQEQFCDGLSFQFNNDSFNATSFFWDFGDPFSLTDTSSLANPFHTYNGEGEYEVTLIANPGWPCADTSSSVYVAFPPVEAVIDGVTFSCNNGVPEYEFNGSVEYDQGFSAEWSFPSGFSQNSSDEPLTTLVAPPAGDYDITYTITENGCEDEDVLSLNVPPSPSAILEPQSLFCNGFTFDFENNSENGSIFFWDFGVQGTNEDTSELFQPSYTYPDSGSYTVLLTVSAPNTCPSTTEAEYLIQGLLDPEFNIPASQCYNGHSFDFQAAGYDSESPEFDWQFGNTATPTNSLEINPSGITWLDPGIYPVSLAISENNCTKVVTQNIEIIPNPTVDFFAPDSQGCPPITVRFFNESTSETPLEYLWTFGDGETSTAVSPFHEYEFSGLFDVSLTATSNQGCLDEVSVTYEDLIHAYPTPTAGFETDVFRLNILEPTINITDLSMGATNCYYDFGDGNFTLDCDPTHEFTNSGFLDITQTVYNDFGCFDTFTIPVIVEGHLFYAPNSFTPNNDGLNDVFKPSVIGSKDYIFKIYNRWGEVVFETDNTLEGWDGSMNNGNYYAPNGVYSYQIVVRDLIEYPHEYNGHVTLIR